MYTYWLQFYGTGSDGAPGSDQMITPFPSIHAAVIKARELAVTDQFYWGRASGFRIRDARKIVVREGAL